jgi:ferric-dicitrate binding protein FerR (iron transport regulator)
MAGATPRHPVESQDLLREAATWFECVHAPDASVELFIHFARWLDSNPEHRTAFEQVEKLCLGVSRVGPSHWPTPDELSADTELPDAAGKVRGD